MPIRYRKHQKTRRTFSFRVVSSLPVGFAVVAPPRLLREVDRRTISSPVTSPIANLRCHRFDVKLVTHIKERPARISRANNAARTTKTKKQVSSSFSHLGGQQPPQTAVHTITSRHCHHFKSAADIVSRITVNREQRKCR